MTKLPNSDDDRSLVEFLRQHRPTPPPPAFALEEQIFLQTKLKSTTSLRWLLPSALIATVVALWGGYRAWEMAKVPAEVAKIETFVANNWDSAVENDTEVDWFRSAE